MIDPAIIDVMNHMNRPPPALVRPLESSAVRSADFFALAEADLQKDEAYIEAWAREFEAGAADVIDRMRKRSFAPESVEALGKMVDLMDRLLIEDAAFYKRTKKSVRRFARRIEASSPADGDRLEPLNRRFLAALARMGTIRFEVGLALKAALIGMDPENRTGPTFDDPAELKKYLLTA